jgi:dephospho-CoA kinase
MTLGITGGMGCGKSTVAGLIQDRGYRRLDSDALIRERVLAAPEVKEALRGRYGEKIVGSDGKVNRGVLAEFVFADEGELQWLEDRTHPALFAIWRREFSADPGGRWVVEVPLLFEKELENWFDFTVCVACSPEQQLARLEQRGIPRVLAGRRISKQLPLSRKIELSDFVLWNEGSPGFLSAEVDNLMSVLAGRS